METVTPEIASTTPVKQPGEIYGTPEKLLAAPYLSYEEKVKLLEQWAVDLEAKLRASDENMTGNQSGQTGDMLRRVKDARRSLDVGR